MTKNSSFIQKVFQVVQKIPRGKVLTYKQVARKIGKPEAARAVGNALNKSPGLPAQAGMPKVPCHRIICSDGKVGGYAKGTKAKIRILKKEGVEVIKGKVSP